MFLNMKRTDSLLVVITNEHGWFVSESIFLNIPFPNTTIVVLVSGLVFNLYQRQTVPYATYRYYKTHWNYPVMARVNTDQLLSVWLVYNWCTCSVIIPQVCNNEFECFCHSCWRGADCSVWEECNTQGTCGPTESNMSLRCCVIWSFGSYRYSVKACMFS